MPRVAQTLASLVPEIRRTGTMGVSYLPPSDTFCLLLVTIIGTEIFLGRSG